MARTLLITQFVVNTALVQILTTVPAYIHTMDQNVMSLTVMELFQQMHQCALGMELALNRMFVHVRMDIVDRTVKLFWNVAE